MFKVISVLRGAGRSGKVSIHNLGCLVARSRRALRREFEVRLAKFELTAPQVQVLMSLWSEDNKTITELSRMVSSDGPTLTSLLDRLEAKNLIMRERDPNDRRTIHIRLCSAGRELKSGVMSAVDEVMDLVRAGMNQQEIDQLCGLLKRLCESVEGPHCLDSCASVKEVRG